MSSLFFNDPENKIFFGITSKLLSSSRFVYFVNGQKTKVSILLNFGLSYNHNALTLEKSPSGMKIIK